MAGRSLKDFAYKFFFFKQKPDIMIRCWIIYMTFMTKVKPTVKIKPPVIVQRKKSFAAAAGMNLCC